MKITQGGYAGHAEVRLAEDDGTLRAIIEIDVDLKAGEFTVQAFEALEEVHVKLKPGQEGQDDIRIGGEQ